MENSTYTVPKETVRETQQLEAPRPGGPPGGMPQRRRRPGRHKRIVKRIVYSLIGLAVAGGMTLLTYIVFFAPAPEFYLTGKIEIGELPIKNVINGWGYLQPESSETVMITESGTVLESNAWPGAPVRKDGVLVVLDSSSIDKAVENYQKQIAALENDIVAVYGQIDKVYDQLREANAEQYAMVQAARMTAPFSGRILNAEKLTIGQEIYKGRPLALLVDDSQMLLTLYFSYAYENDIYIGQLCEVSVPGSMSVVPGTVSDIEKVRRVGADGTVTFVVEITLNNPGALTTQMAATASMRTADGEAVLPAGPGELEYIREEWLITESQGPLKQNNLRDYYTVREGELLVLLDFTPDTSIEEGYMLTIRTHESSIEAKEDQIEGLLEAIEQEYERMEDLTIRSPIDGVVMGWTEIWPGMTVGPGTQITVAQMETLTLHGEVYQTDIQKISEGMDVAVDAWQYGEMVTIPGTLTKIDRTASQMGGGAYYPVIIAVDNRQGQLMEGSGANFQIVLDASIDNPILVPVQAIKGIGKAEYVFLKPRDGKRPENAEDLPDGIVPPGFYAIRVKIGIQNSRQAEITDGLLPEWEGWEVFTQKTDTLPSPGPSYEFDPEVEDMDPLDAYEKGYQKGLEEQQNASPEPGDDPFWPDGGWDDGWDGGWDDGGMSIWPDDGAMDWPDDGYFDEEGNWIPFETHPDADGEDGGDGGLPDGDDVFTDGGIVMPMPAPDIGGGGGVIIRPGR